MQVINAVRPVTFIPNKKLKNVYCLRSNITKLNGFILSNGSGIKHRLFLAEVLKNLNYFVYFNKSYILANYPTIASVVNEIISKKLNSTFILNTTVDLIKLPFTVKSIAITKKLKKKTKQKYLIKINYRNESKRINNTLKQLSYFSNRFHDNKYKYRLYKAIITSFLDWKNSHLFKLKLTVFKKFFKF